VDPNSGRWALLDVLQSELTRAKEDILALRKNVHDLRTELQIFMGDVGKQQVQHEANLREVKGSVERIERAAERISTNRPQWAIFAVTALGIAVSAVSAWSASRSASQAQPTAVVEKITELETQLAARDAQRFVPPRRVENASPAK
jgi:soluble cytochrome b562